MEVYPFAKQFETSLSVRKDELSFRFFRLQEGEKRKNISVKETSIIFLLEGEFLFFDAHFYNKRLRQGEMLLLPLESSIDIMVQEDAHIIICTFSTQIQLCADFYLDSLFFPDEDAKTDFHVLTINNEIRNFLLGINEYMKNRILCHSLYEIKKQEMFFLMKTLYGREELSAFFSPILNRDIFFKESVLKNYHQTQTVMELASLMRYSVSGFKKKFDRCFGMSAHKWLQQQRATEILKDLREGRKTLKDIAMSHHFSSQARFHEFCRKYYGETPGKIRKSKC